MDTFIKKIQDDFSNGDQEVRTWFLVGNNYLPFILCGCYIIVTTIIGPALMRNRKPFELRNVMIVFNFFLVATYTIFLSVGLWYLPGVSKEQFCYGTKVKKGDITYTLATAAWVLYVLKYVEFLDTVFFILRKKENQITFLHVVHHTVVPLCVWVCFRTEKSGMQAIPGIINSFVHIIMYSYYGLAAIGPRVRKYLWWKKYLTQLQMIQFFLIIFFVAVVAPLSGCRMVISSYFMDIILAPLFLYLFYQFYKSTFAPKRKSVEINGNVKDYPLKNGTVNKESYTNGNSEKCTLTNAKIKKQD